MSQQRLCSGKALCPGTVPGPFRAGAPCGRTPFNKKSIPVRRRKSLCPQVDRSQAARTRDETTGDYNRTLLASAGPSDLRGRPSSTDRPSVNSRNSGREAFSSPPRNRCFYCGEARRFKIVGRKRLPARQNSHSMAILTNCRFMSSCNSTIHRKKRRKGCRSQRCLCTYLYAILPSFSSRNSRPTRLTAKNRQIRINRSIFTPP
jgi:hypothetical protein